jgi:hypothetical protein
MSTPELDLALSFAQAIRAEQTQMSANGERVDTLEASRRARARIEHATSEREISEASQRVEAAKLNRAAPSPSSSAAHPASSAPREAQQGHLSSRAPRKLATVPGLSWAFSIGLGRLTEEGRAIADRFLAERCSGGTR